MDKLVYIDGAVADQIGKLNIQALADIIAALCGERITLLTHTESHHHGKTRFRSAGDMPLERARALAKTIDTIARKEGA